MRTAVIGGGPGGMTAAISAARQGDEVTLFEQNEKTGKKLYITGKGRCNLTNACDKSTFFENVIHNPRFFYSAFASFSNDDLMALIETTGCELKVERGNRVFPKSDKSSDIIKAFNVLLKRYHVSVRLNSRVEKINTRTEEEQERIIGLETATGQEFEFDKIIMATGGLTYRSTGADGSGIEMARDMGHKIKKCRPSLVGLKSKDKWPTVLQGLSLKNVGLSLYKNNKKIAQDFGEMLFTHFGISGPMVLTYSAKMDGDPSMYHMILDLKPALSQEQVHNRLLKDFEVFKNKQLSNALVQLMPSMMIPVFIRSCDLDPEQRINQISKKERQLIENRLKNWQIDIEDYYAMDSAIITSGGIDTKTIDPKTMASKVIKGLYFAGEMIDVDALTGGFNIQIAVSTGWLAGMHK